METTRAIQRQRYLFESGGDQEKGSEEEIDHSQWLLDTQEKALRDLAKEASNNRQQQQARQRAEIGNLESEKESVIQVLQQAIKSSSLSGQAEA
ncbi:hypothetical protein H4Q26_011544 [Puccinia striiformis f. sp. tritici PST-130]|nr:hypothetical protein H4Q26_011544 [Puccinia striiformis f. sp. tritici PST-130]